MTFFSRDRWRTIWLRRVTCRRSAWVGSSGDPDFRQEAAGIELRKHAGVDRVGLDLGVRDDAHLLRVGDHHLLHMRAR